MKRRKQYIVTWIAILLIFIIGLIFFLIQKKQVTLIVPFDKNYTQEVIDPKPEIITKGKEKKEVLSVLPENNNIKISLDISGKKYNSDIKKGSSVFEAMEEIKNDSTSNELFDFKYKETPGLGNFITEINGMKGAPGKYWIYYINNEKATIGASEFILKEGDIIRWNQEGI